ncbi:MAG: hypothetical protein AMXMBFR84_19880 [Candidatus Hydrogenedentota bacterium]
MHGSYRVRVILAAMAFAGFLWEPGAFAQSNELFRPVVWGPTQIPSDLIQYSAVFQSQGRRQDLHFLNVVRSDGTWVVQNLPVGLEPGLTQIATVIPASQFISGDLYHTTFSTTYQRTAPAFVVAQAVLQVLGAAINFLVNGGACRDGYGTFVDPGAAPTTLVSFPPPPLPFFPPFRYVYRSEVPDTEQGPNECAPTSAANSLAWMESVYDAIDIGLTPEEIRDELKGPDFMKTSAATGTSDADFVSGKNAFAEAYDLPIETRAVPGGVGPAPGMDDLYAELEQGSDVELSVVWLDKNGQPNGGHWVTVVGMIEIQGQYGVYIKDPDDGVDQTQFHWIDTNPDGKHSLRGYGGAHVVDLTIAESVKRPGLCGSGGAAVVVPPVVLLLAFSRRLRRRAGQTERH